MYAEIVGRWIAGPVQRSQLTTEAQSSIRIPQPIDWPSGEDGLVVVRLLDQDDQPIRLNLPTDTITLNLGYDFQGSTVFSAVGVAGSDPGYYEFSVTAQMTKNISGPFVYEVRSVFGGVTQQVCAPAYFTVTPKVAA